MNNTVSKWFYQNSAISSSKNKLKQGDSKRIKSLQDLKVGHKFMVKFFTKWWDQIKKKKKKSKANTNNTSTKFIFQAKWKRLSNK